MSARDKALEHMWQLIRHGMADKKAYAATIKEFHLSPVEAHILKSGYCMKES